MAAKTTWIGNKSVPDIIINRHNKFIFKTAISILVISNQNSFRVLFDKIASAYFTRKLCLCFSTGNGQPREPALCQFCIGTLSFPVDMQRNYVTVTPCITNAYYGTDRQTNGRTDTRTDRAIPECLLGRLGA